MPAATLLAAFLMEAAFVMSSVTALQRFVKPRKQHQISERGDMRAIVPTTV